MLDGHFGIHLHLKVYWMNTSEHRDTPLGDACEVSAYIGIPDRVCESHLAVDPDSVKASMAVMS